VAERRARRVAVPLAVALVVLLATAASVAIDRIQRSPFAVEAIDVPYTMLTVPASPPPAAIKPAAPVAQHPAARSCPKPAPLPTETAAAAVAAGTRLDVHAAPDGRRTTTLPNPTREGQRLHVLVREARGSWLRVQLPVRPNGTTGWVRSTDVRQFPAPYRILVELCAHRLTLYKAGRQVWQRPVAVGKPATPTPTGSFYVDFVTTMWAGGAYGPYMLSVAGFSNVLQGFGGGIGQIALHGTNRPASVGTSASHGCVRLRNADITWLAHTVPPGTPVTIAA
jgi:lipoprotein-anchoring transpeptidase ErfK/SrfK